MNYQTIGEFTSYLKLMFDNSTKMRNVYLKGEISNFKRHPTGHLYFSLKDEKSKINAIMFARDTFNLKFNPTDGTKVLVHGRVSIYEQAGNYQIYVDEMEEDGIGNLYKKYEELKKKLELEGLFDQEHKKVIPFFPKSGERREKNVQHAARNAWAWLCTRKLCHLLSSPWLFQLISSRRAVPGAVLLRFSPLPLAREDERFVCLSFVLPVCAAFCRACAAFSAAAACLSA